MKKNKDFAEITSLRIQAGLRHKDLAKLVGYSAFWVLLPSEMIQF